MRYELTDHEWAAIKPMLPNKPRGVPRVNDRRVLRLPPADSRAEMRSPRHPPQYPAYPLSSLLSFRDKWLAALISTGLHRAVLEAVSANASGDVISATHQSLRLWSSA
jgi:transposase